MSFPNIPNITPTISVTTEQTIPLLLSSIALEELSLAHLINAEAEKLQFVLGTLETNTTLPSQVTISNILDVNDSIRRTFRDVIKKEMLLEFKFENILDLITTPGVITPPTPPVDLCGCQVANTAGMDFFINRGQGDAGSIVSLNTDVQNPPGSVTYNGLICSDCEPDDNFFTFTYGGSVEDPDIPPFVFEATSFNVPNCPGGQLVTITGQGTVAGTNIFGPNPVYALTVNEVNDDITLVITGNGNTFTATVTNLGVGEIDLTNCP